MSVDPMAETSDEESAPDEQSLRELSRQQVIQSIGGWTGMVIAGLPPLVFVIVNSLASLRPAIYAAVGTGVLLTVVRLLRRESIQQAMGGLLGVAVAAWFANRTGHARDFFLPGIWINAGYCAGVGISLLVRRPAVGLVWEFLDPSPGPTPWYRRAHLLRAYMLATGAFFAMYAAKAGVQYFLFLQAAEDERKTGFLAVARIAMGAPLFATVLGFSLWIVYRARHRHAAA